MNKNSWTEVKTIFYEAIDLSVKERENYLNTNCKDPELKQEIISLLAAHDKAEKFLENPILPKDTIAENDNIFIGKFFGRYRIEKLIAQGGMGMVYMGLRDDEVKQKAAVKIINPGASSNIVIKRFQTERQTLANLNHPNISRLLDGGITQDGIQFLVMEYIDGIPIDEYCDNYKLNIKERLKLFLKVAAVVQYAHQNLVVHRDLKPNNILVTKDGEPKLLDFGIAKILSPEGEENETLTNKGGWNLTPEYASPEQVKGESITTASDVYSLGIILYKLLTGHSPYKIKSILHSDITRIITQTEPVKPSEIIYQTVERKSGEEIIHINPETVSRTREGSVDKLHKKLSGDLDNVISMAIRKEPGRRYSSVEHFSKDLKNYLEEMPVSAHKNSIGYRGKKFIKRNKAVIIPAAVIFIIINIGLAGILWQGHLAAKERDIANFEAEKANRIKAFLLDMISAPDPMKDGGEIKVIDVIQKAAGNLSNDLSNQPEIEAEVRTILGTTYQNLGIYDSAITQMNKSLELTKNIFGEKSKETAMGLKNLGLVYHYKGDYEKTEEIYKNALEILNAVEKNPSFETALLFDIYGSLKMDEGDYKKAEELSLKALEIGESIRNANDYDIAWMKNNLATALNYLGELDKADSLYKESLRVFKMKFGNNHIMVSRVLNNLAFINIYKNEHEKALPYLEEALEIKKNILGESHPELVLAYSNLGSTYFNIGKYDHAEEQMKLSVDIALKNFEEDNINTSRSYMWYGRTLEANGKINEGIYYLKKAYLIRKKEFGEKNNLTLTAQNHFGNCLLTAKNFLEAEKHLSQSYIGMNELLGSDDPTIKKALASLIKLYKLWGRNEKADQYSRLIKN
ncbi:MAG: serine/threonine protein kinase [Ignavibacteriales bacterium]|nr:MAG: serine/threonine protein kinase [Ignavibacteriales bacterium]